MPSTGASVTSVAGTASSSSAEVEPAVLKAQSAFHTVASQQLKRLMADGVQRDTASVQLMDQMLQYGAGPAACSSACASPQLQHVISVTGFTRMQAAKTLLLKEEIGQLRRQGHGTTALIELLQKRLRFTAQPSSRSDENSSAPATRQPHKKLKRDEEGHQDLLWPPLHASQAGLRGELVEMRPATKKQRPDDAPPPHKRSKPRLTAQSANLTSVDLDGI
mmetsp:Transcript_13788/g.27960  ORF Transcript_13788/g.27960 Transcript_13788/m.27960 type:complete len:220 (+) Transcript_13788:74-733(+)